MASSKSFILPGSRLHFQTEEEKSQYLGYNSSATGHVTAHDLTVSDDVIPDEVPNSVDWIAKGAVTKAKDQARCGSCWTFGSVSTITKNLT